jgi:hypothetical protein
MVASSPRSIWETRTGGRPWRGEPGLGQAVAFPFFGEPLAALAGHQRLAAPLGFFLAADAVDVGAAVPLGVTAHRPDSSSARSFK